MFRKSWKILLFIFLIGILITLIFVFRNNKNVLNEKVLTFSGIVDEVTATKVTVKPDDTKFGDKIVVNTSSLDFHKGENITVSYVENKEEPTKIEVVNITKNEYSKIVKLYLTVIDSIMAEEVSLNSGIEYLSVDTDSFISYPSDLTSKSSYPRISDEDENKILQYATKYSEDVRKDSVDELKDKGLFDEKTNSFKGMVIYLEKVTKFADSKVEFTLVKYVGNTGALFVDYTLEYDGVEWKITGFNKVIS